MLQDHWRPKIYLYAILGNRTYLLYDNLKQCLEHKMILRQNVLLKQNVISFQVRLSSETNETNSQTKKGMNRKRSVKNLLDHIQI